MQPRMREAGRAVLIIVLYATEEGYGTPPALSQKTPWHTVAALPES